MYWKAVCLGWSLSRCYFLLPHLAVGVTCENANKRVMQMEINAKAS